MPHHILATLLRCVIPAGMPHHLHTNEHVLHAHACTCLLRYVIPAEEALLKKLFGKEYDDFAATTPRWLFKM